MTNASSRSRLTSATSHFAVAVMLASASPAWAQDAQPAPTDAQAQAAQEAAAAAADAAAAQSADDQTESAVTGPASPEGASPSPEADEGAIVVTGFRASLQNARQQEEEFRADRRIGHRRGHRQAARRVDRRIDRAASGPDLAAPVGPRRLDLHPRLRARFLDDAAQRPRTDLDRRQPRGRIRPVSVRDRQPGQSSTRPRWPRSSARACRAPSTCARSARSTMASASSPSARAAPIRHRQAQSRGRKK